MFDVFAECPGPRTFLLARSRQRNGIGAYWAHSAYFRFDAPPGTTISRLRMWRHGQTVKEGELEEWDILAQTDDGELAFEKCFHPPGQGVCNTGAPGASRRPRRVERVARHPRRQHRVRQSRRRLQPERLQELQHSGRQRLPVRQLQPMGLRRHDPRRRAAVAAGGRRDVARGWHRPASRSPTTLRTAPASGRSSAHRQAPSRRPGHLRLPQGGALLRDASRGRSCSAGRRPTARTSAHQRDRRGGQRDDRGAPRAHRRHTAAGRPAPAAEAQASSCACPTPRPGSLRARSSSATDRRSRTGRFRPRSRAGRCEPGSIGASRARPTCA